MVSTSTSIEFEDRASTKYHKRTVVDLTLRWRIKEVHSQANPSLANGFFSGELSSKFAPRIAWKMSLTGVAEEHGSHLVFFVLGEMVQAGDTPEILGYHLYLVGGADGDIVSIRRGTGEYGKMDGLCRADFGFYQAEISDGQMRKALHADGSLVVGADVEFVAPSQADGEPIDGGVIQCYKDRAAKLSSFYGDEATCDCSIKIGGATLRAHKFVLMLCSPVFRSMFTQEGMTESTTNTIEIPDCENPASMRAVLHHCYHGHFDAEAIDEAWALEAFQLADKYLIEDLKATLQNHLIKTLDVENVVRMAEFADTHNAPELKEACASLVTREANAVFARAEGEWIELEETKPELTAYLSAAAQPSPASDTPEMMERDESIGL